MTKSELLAAIGQITATMKAAVDKVQSCSLEAVRYALLEQDFTFLAQMEVGYLKTGERRP